VPPERYDTRLLLFAAGAVLLAGVAVALVLLFATGTGGPKEYVPFSAGLATDVKRNLKEEGPFYVADPFGGNRSIVFALEDGEVVALSTTLPGTEDCVVKWKAQLDRFVDCDGGRHRSTDLDRYEDFVDPSGEDKGLLLVDLRKKLPAPGTATAAN
jgi:hypothetical protein